MGELIKRQKTAVAQASNESVAVRTMGGHMHVRWDKTAQATTQGQIVYFAWFFATAGILRVGYSAARRAIAVPTHRASATCWVV